MRTLIACAGACGEGLPCSAALADALPATRYPPNAATTAHSSPATARRHCGWRDRGLTPAVPDFADASCVPHSRNPACTESAATATGRSFRTCPTRLRVNSCRQADRRRGPLTADGRWTRTERVRQPPRALGSPASLLSVVRALDGDRWAIR